MGSVKRLDVVEILVQEKEFYIEQIERINVALAALGSLGEKSRSVLRENPKQSRKVKWMAETEKIFETNASVSVDLIQKKMIEKGITQADSTGGRNAINTTLTRLVGKGKIIRGRDGMYRKAVVLNLNPKPFKQDSGSAQAV